MTDQFPDATKMVLSPAAQAVLDAAEQVPIVLNYAQEIPAFCAAALRAAADRLVYEAELDEPMMTTVHVVDAADLYAIAAELEQQS